MKYIVDRIEEDIVVLLKYGTNEIIEIDKKILSDNIHDGSIIVFDGNKYYLDIDDEEKRRQEILNRFIKLRNKEENY